MKNLTNNLTLSTIFALLSTLTFAQTDTTPEPIDGRIFKVETADSDHEVLEVPDMDPHHGARISLFRYYKLPNQHWLFRSTGNGTYQIIAQHSGLALSRIPYSLTSSDLTQQIPDLENADQIWKVELLEGGDYKIIASNSEFALEHNGTSIVAVNQFSGQSSQIWHLSTEITQMPAVKIQSVETSMWITNLDQNSQTGREVGAQLEPDHFSQTFQIILFDSGGSAFRSYFETGALDIEGGSLKNGGNLHCYQFSYTNDLPNQKWLFEDADDDTVYIKNVNSGLYLTVETAPQGVNANIEQYEKNPFLAQKWKILEVNTQSESYPVAQNLPSRFPREDYNPFRFEAENFDLRSGYYDTDAVNHGVKFDAENGYQVETYRETGVDIRVDSNNSENHLVGWIQNGEWLKYTIQEMKKESYQVTVRVASPYDGNKLIIGFTQGLDDFIKYSGNISHSWSNAIYPKLWTSFYEVDVPNTGSNDAFVDVTLPTVELPRGSNGSMVIQAVGSGMDIDWIEFSIKDDRPAGFTSETDVETYFPGIVLNENRSAGNVAWLGGFQVYYFPWINHVEHGWFYCDGLGGDSIRFWDSHLGWLTTSPDTYPTFVVESNGHTLIYEIGSKTIAGTLRRFWNENDEKWIEINYSNPPVQLY